MLYCLFITDLLKQIRSLKCKEATWNDFKDVKIAYRIEFFKYHVVNIS